MTDAQLGLWLGFIYAVLLFAVSTVRNRKPFAEQVGFIVQGAFTCQNLIPAARFIAFALGHEPSLKLPPPLEGSDKYLLIAGLASEVVTVVSLYSAFTQAWRRRQP